MRVRISTAFQQELSVNAMLTQQTNIAQTQEQMALGLRVVRPSDDPPAAVRALILKESIEVNKQYQTNINMAKSRLSLEDSVLDGVVDALQKLNELGIEALNAPLSQKEHDAIDAEVRQVLSQIMDLANTKTDTGEYLFAGLKSTTVPFSGNAQTGGYTYNGDDQLRYAMIGNGHNINDNDPGSKAFTVQSPLAAPTVPPTTLPPENILNLMFNFAEHLKASKPDSYDLANIQLSIRAISGVRVTVGARLAALDQQESLNQKLTTDEKAHLSQTQDLDYTEAVSTLNMQSAALQAAQQAYAKVQKLSLFNYF